MQSHTSVRFRADIIPALITYVITIGAWSLVWSCFIGRQIFLRWKMNIMRGKSFGAMNVLFLAGIQSMILPSTYCASALCRPPV